MTSPASPSDTPDPWLVEYSTLYQRDTLEATQRMLRLLQTASPANVATYSAYTLQRLIGAYGTVPLLETFLANAYVKPDAGLTDVITAAMNSGRADLARVLAQWQTAPPPAIDYNQRCYYCDRSLHTVPNVMLPCCHRSCQNCAHDALEGHESAECHIELAEGGRCNVPFRLEQLTVPGASPVLTSPTSPTEQSGEVTDRLMAVQKIADALLRFITVLDERRRQFSHQPDTGYRAQLVTSVTSDIKTVEQDYDRLAVYRDHLQAAAAAGNAQRLTLLLHQHPPGLTLRKTMKFTPSMPEPAYASVTLTEGATPTVVIGRTVDDYRNLEGAFRPVGGLWDAKTIIVGMRILTTGDFVVGLRTDHETIAIVVLSPDGEPLRTLTSISDNDVFLGVGIATTSDDNVWIVYRGRNMIVLLDGRTGQELRRIVNIDSPFDVVGLADKRVAVRHHPQFGQPLGTVLTVYDAAGVAVSSFNSGQQWLPAPENNNTLIAAGDNAVYAVTNTPNAVTRFDFTDTPIQAVTVYEWDQTTFFGVAFDQTAGVVVLATNNDLIITDSIGNGNELAVLQDVGIDWDNEAGKIAIGSDGTIYTPIRGKLMQL